ncbi:MAG TPA: DinB family protein [Gemmatimonadales bacterium]
MTFSNPAGNAVASAAAYVRALLEVLGSRPPLEVLNELVPWLAERTQGIGEATLRQPEAPGKWSVVHVVQHLADSELVFGFRLRMILTQDEPELVGYDQDRWAHALGYQDVPLDLALGQLRGLRTPHLRLARALTPRQLERVGRHSERGPESVAHLLKLMAAHDLVHRRQIERILAAARR